MKLIPLTKGYFAKVDDEYFEKLSKFKWQVFPLKHSVYAKRAQKINGKVVTHFMHREIINPEPGQQIDHIDFDGLNNQKLNLRIATSSQNCQHRKQKNRLSLFKGISFCKTHKKYKAAIFVNKKRKFLGYFRDAKDAAMAYDVAAVANFGSFAVTNQQLGAL